MSVVTRSIQTPGRSIIDLTLTSPTLGYLPVWKIDAELATPSDHELITFNLENMDRSVENMGSRREITGWAIKYMTNNQMQEAYKMWNEIA